MEAPRSPAGLFGAGIFLLLLVVIFRKPVAASLGLAALHAPALHPARLSTSRLPVQPPPGGEAAGARRQLRGE